MGTPTALTGAFDLADDIDDFRVTLVAGQRYLFTLIGNGSTPLLAIRGSFDSALDADYFRVWLVQGQRYHFDVIGSGSNAQAFPSLELFAPVPLNSSRRRFSPAAAAVMVVPA